ncbi:phage tail protein [Alkaliphilus peptidifermentans]|uniref:Microcystin-dependent protein n=1 Tax=Alkaliphilus peptidifermentans DSM 18978 TaxID=1120976 RepID=A0A1G5AWS8_9FIRM|nr:tail fiber protein [Alkaliphilus peptidifermentans]SCX82323.1 Microcystin-dependent protein [Alkaliphilus peptidifermentans DSM 18978]
MDQYVGEIRMFAGDYAPIGWALCHGQLLSVFEHEMLFSVIRTSYGGDGITNFAVPDLRGRIPIHQGQSVGGKNYIIGQKGGTEEVTLTNIHLPIHSHNVTATSAEGTEASPEGAYPSNKIAQYTQETTDLSHMNANSISYEGGNQPHNNMMPYLAINYIIALEGDYPIRD